MGLKQGAITVVLVWISWGPEGTAPPAPATTMANFYEGMMVTGVTTDATGEPVQANIVAVGYKNVDGATAASGHSA